MAVPTVPANKTNEAAVGPVAAAAPAPDRAVQRAATAATAVVVVLLVAVESVLLRAGGWDPGTVIFWQSVIVSYSVSGILALWRQPHNSFGLLLIGAGLAMWSAGLQSAPHPGIALIGDITQTVPLAALVHLLVAFPYGRLPDRISRGVVAGTYLVALVLQAPRYLFAGDGIVVISDQPWIAEAARSSQSVVGMAALGVALWVLVRRGRSAGRDRRHRLGPLSWYGPAALTVMILVMVFAGLFGQYREQIGYVQTGIVGSLPVVFLVGLLSGAFGRAGELREFLIQVGADRMRPEHLDAAVARALGDPAAHVVYSAGAAGGYVHADGSLVQLGTGQLARPVNYGRDPVGAIVHDADATIDERLLDAVARVCALAVDHQRAVAALRAALLDVERHTIALRQAQFRIVQASDAERRRIARDLHDGVQQTVVVLGMGILGLARGADDPGRVRAAAADLQTGMARLLSDFRALVHGIMPAALTDRGIVPAIRELGERTPVPLTLRSSGLDRRLPEAIESTVYFLVCEIATNAVKHAAPSGIWVTLEYSTDGGLRAEVRDDGNGGAALDGGTGLQGIRDRVLALNGCLTVSSPVGRGTVVQALIPCG